MTHRETAQENFLPPESREGHEFFDLITKDRLQQLVDEFSADHGVDLSRFDIRVTRPGDSSFDILEVMTKLQNQYGPNEVISLLKDYDVDLSKPFDHSAENAEKMRIAGAGEGLELDGVLKGFVYNAGGNIIYTAVRADQVQNLATTYSEKEGEKKDFINPEAAKAYLEKLAEKYLYHEIGHSVFRQMVTSSADRMAWFEAVNANEPLMAEIYELQKEKYPAKNVGDLLPIIFDEAFAEVFSQVSTNGKVSSRVSSYPQTEELLKTILQKYGFKLG